MNLTHVLSLGQWRILYDSTPALRVRQAGISDCVEQVVPSVDGRDGPVQGIFNDFAGAEQGWNEVSQISRYPFVKEQDIPFSTMFRRFVFLLRC